ncbi:Asp23/Gls24 family envelope stress response protein [Rhodococcoides corynebacterioides]|uniref:Asp23/Gls24 family envelope stress response protein n=1 Tax=Rhodococcoides corynebacterioides TaxID=53972 RepID=UPI001C9B394B|nr:Asp23/Gls24 family envelope stress response protein [Rhodococcus corynebacterioides]MBY6349286.1 Asp23/Gls24 family envelope stress response protein [Rhodococcus corynebacterioides]
MTTQYTPSTTSRVPAGSRGRTTVTPVVVATVAGLAAAEVTGMRAHRTRVDRHQSRSVQSRRGVAARVHRGHTTLRFDVVADYGVVVPEVAADVRRAVGAAVYARAGVRVDTVDVAVHDVSRPPRPYQPLEEQNR